MSASIASGISSIRSHKADDSSHTLSKNSHAKSLATQKSEETIPDFNAIHNSYAKALVRGRHPNSFPKESELWYHFRTSSERVKKISFGYDMCDVIKDQEQVYTKHKLAELKAQSEQIAKVQEVVVMPTTHQNATQMRTINGVQIDMKGQVQMHYGMVFIMMNMMEEVLCVNRWDEVKCKPIQNIDITDRICFKILHLGDPTNPGVVKYGAPMWLQLWDHGEGVDNAWQNSSVLAAKPFGPPEMGAMELDRVWGKSGSKDKEAAPPPPMSAGSTSVPAPPSSPSGKSGKLPRINTPSSQSTRQATTPQPTSSTTSTTTGSASAKDKDKEKDKEAKDTVAEGDSGGAEAGDEATSPQPSIQVITERSGGVDNESLAAIIGDLQPVRVTDKRGEADAVLAGPRNHTKTAWFMAQWVGRLATRSKLKNDVIFTQSPIYLEQDLYCLATGHGTGFRPWPKSSSEIEFREASFPKLVHLGAESSRSTTFENMNRMMGLVKTTAKSDRLVGGSGGIGMVGAAAVGGVPSANPSTSVASTEGATKPQHRDVGEYGCVRKVSIRGPPYKNLVDRRCVWKFCAVDTQGDMQSLSVKDQITQRLMNRARVELRKSEQNRKGICIHKGYEYRGQPLTRGEGFTRTLRAIILQNTHNLEIDDMKLRRDKEKHLKKHFADMMVVEESAFDGDEEYDYADSEIEEGEGDDQTELSLVSGLSDDHYSPYKDGVSGTEKWDESALQGTISIPAKPASRGGSRGASRHTARFGEVVNRTSNDKVKKKKVKKITGGSNGSSHSRSSVKVNNEEEAVSSTVAESMLEQAFHVDKFVPSYLPMKPLAYSQPSYDHPEGAKVQARNPTRKKIGSISGKTIESEEDAVEILDPKDFGSVLSHELDSVAMTHTMPAHQFYGPGGVPIEDDKPKTETASANAHVVVHVPSHPLANHGHGGHHMARNNHHAIGKSDSAPQLHGSYLASNVGPSIIAMAGGGTSSLPVTHSRDGTRQISLDNHIDLFQSDGERVVAIYDVMDYYTTKTANDVKNGDYPFDSNSSIPHASNNSSPQPGAGINAATTVGKKNISRLSSIGAQPSLISDTSDTGPSLTPSVMNKIAKLQMQDENLSMVLKHRESMAQYNRLTQLFQDLKTI